VNSTYRVRRWWGRSPPPPAPPAIALEPPEEGLNSRDTILAIERQINDGQQLSAGKETT